MRGTVGAVAVGLAAMGWIAPEPVGALFPVAPWAPVGPDKAEAVPETAEEADGRRLWPAGRLVEEGVRTWPAEAGVLPVGGGMVDAEAGLMRRDRRLEVATPGEGREEEGCRE